MYICLIHIFILYQHIFINLLIYSVTTHWTKTWKFPRGRRPSNLPLGGVAAAQTSLHLGRLGAGWHPTKEAELFGVCVRFRTWGEKSAEPPICKVLASFTRG